MEQQKLKFKTVYGAMNWWDAAEQPSLLSELPLQFTQAHDLWSADKTGNFTAMVNLLRPFLFGVFVAENLEKYPELFDFDDIPECETRNIQLVGIEFDSQAPIPRVKTEAYFDVPCVENIDEIKLTDWFEGQLGNLWDCISFYWEIPINGKNHRITYGDHQGVEAIFL